MIHGHTLEVMRWFPVVAVYSDTNLRVMRTTKRKIMHARTNVDHTVRFVPALLGVTYTDSMRAYGDGRKQTKEASATILGIRTDDLLDVRSILPDFFLSGSGPSENFHLGLMTGAQLIDLDAMYDVAFVFQLRHSGTKFRFAHIEHVLGAASHIDIML